LWVTPLLILGYGAAGWAQDKPPVADIPDVTVASYPAGAVNLLPQGDFEKANEAGDGPAGWQAVDNLVFHWTSDPGDPSRGKVLHINTDVQQSQAYAWWIERFVKGAKLDRAPVRLPTREPKYDTIAGLDGGWFWSDFIPIKPDRAYKVYVDARGPKAKVFIRGYEKVLPLSFGDEAPAVQELFREPRGEATVDAKGRPVKYRLRYRYQTWFAVGGSDQWQTCTHIKPRHPTGRELTENVRYIRITLYPYWPPADYWFDNIRVVEVDPDDQQRKPEAEEADIEEGKVVR
jgi:hypothetical protein